MMGTVSDHPSDLRVRPSLMVPGGELRWRFSRSSGPGGQSVNTTDSRVELSFDLAASSALGPVHRERALARLADRLVDGVVTVTASEHRSQLQNRRAARALERLGDRLVDGVITVAASEHRSQLQNRRAAEERLTELLVAAVAPPPRKRRATRPSKGAVQRRLDEKKRRGQTKRLRRDLGE